MNSEIKAWLKDIGVAIVIALIITQFISPTIVKEHSMLNTLNENDYLILWKQAYTFGEPDFGDIVVFKSELTTENGKKKLLIKRVIGLPGDRITIYSGKVYLNDRLLEEPYIKDGYTPGEILDFTVPDNELFLMGDNRVNSIDSRAEEVGTVEEKLLIGKAVFRLYPFSEIGSLY